MLKLIKMEDMDFEVVEEYYEAFSNKNEMLCYSLKHVRDGEQEYLNFVKRYDYNSYYLIDDEDPMYIIGYGGIEDSEYIDFHLDYLNIGNIYYSIRPNERNKGYGTKLLRLLLKECEKLGMRDVCVSCGKDNIASKKVILNNEGKFEKEFFDDFEGEGLKFWIKAHPKISSRITRLIKSGRTR